MKEKKTWSEKTGAKSGDKVHTASWQAGSEKESDKFRIKGFNMKLIEIVWYDSKGVTTEWEFRDEMKSMEPAVVHSTGYLLDETE